MSHDAAVCEAWHSESRHLPQCPLVVERRGERLARIGHERERLFALLAIRHVPAEADHAGRLAGGVGHHLRLPPDPAHSPVRPDDPKLDVVAGLTLEGRLDRLEHERPVVRMDECLVVLERPVEFSGLEPVDRREPLGPHDRPGLDVPGPDSHLGGIESHSQLFLALSQAALGSLSFRDVVHERDHTPDPAGRVAYGGVRERDVDQHPVLALPDRLEGRERLAGKHPLANRVELVEHLGLDERQDPSDRFLRRPSEHLLRRWVPERHSSCRVIGDDG